MTLPTGTLTLFFTDVEGSTRLQQEVGERYAEYLAEHHRIVRDALERHEGTEVDTQGEAFFATFTRATDAAAAAADVQRASADHPFAVRIGLHTGQPRLAETGYVGLDVPRAARICTAAHGGQVLLSSATRELLGDTFATKNLGEHRLKDLIEPISLHQLVADGLAETFPPPRTLETRPSNLPVQPTLLVGRTREVEAVSVLLRRDDVRLLTLTGAGGTGKTRIGLQVAAELVDDFDDGVFFVPLEAVTDPGLVLPAIAQSLGVAQTGDADLERSVREYVGSRSLLLVLDNFEQLASAAALLADLLTTAPRIRLLVTSREPLHLSAEHEYPVPPLSVPSLDCLPELAALSQYESVALFVDRARAARPEFAVTTENAPAIAEICVRLDGLPLAIELAAARVRLLTPQAMLARLGRRLELLTGGARDLPSRQRTLRGAIDWSYELLDADAQRLLARLSVFAGGCSLDAAESVCDATLDGLESLIDKNLLRQEEDPGGEPRFTLLETIREYAAERLDESPDGDLTRRRHLEWIVAWFEERRVRRIEGTLAGGFVQDELEHENGQAALAYARAAGASEEELRLANGMRYFWLGRGYYAHGRDRLEAALERAPDAPPELRTLALVGVGFLAWSTGDWETAQRAALDAQAASAGLEDKLISADVANLLGLVSEDFGDRSASAAYYDEAERLFREAGANSRLGLVLNNRAYSLIVHGEYEAALPYLVESRELMPTEGASLLNLALVSLFTGDLETAGQRFVEALDAGDESTNASILFYALEGLACVAAARGEDELAGRLWGAAETARERIGAPLEAAERNAHELFVAKSRKRAGSSVLDAAWAEGRALATDTAVEQARSLVGR